MESPCVIANWGRNAQNSNALRHSGILCIATISRVYAQYVELIPFETVTVSTQQILSGAKDGKQAVVAGELRIPKSGSEKLSAVIVMQGAGGITPMIAKWAETINSIGVASFVLDSYAGRHMAEPSKLDILAPMIDACRALGVLAAHPKIDPKRIAIMGISKGSMAALYSSNVRFRNMYGPQGVEFAADIALFAPCIRTYRDDNQVTGRPIRLFHGIADDVFPIEACREYVDRLKQAGADIQLTEFPGAYHSFDAFILETPIINTQSLSTRNCRLVEGDNGQLLNRTTGSPFAMTDACVQRGNTYAYNAAAATATAAAVKYFLIGVFNREQ